LIFSLSQFIGCFFNDVDLISKFSLTHDNCKSLRKWHLTFRNVCKSLKLFTEAVILLKTCEDMTKKEFWKILLPLIEKVISYIRVFDIQLSLHEGFFKQLDLSIKFCIINLIHQIQEKLLEDPKSANNEAAIMVVYYVRWTIFIFFRVFKHVSKSLI